MSVQRNASRFKAGYKNRIVKGSFYYIETYNEEDKIIKLGMTFIHQINQTQLTMAAAACANQKVNRAGAANGLSDRIKLGVRYSVHYSLNSNEIVIRYQLARHFEDLLSSHCAQSTFCTYCLLSIMQVNFEMTTLVALKKIS